MAKRHKIPLMFIMEANIDTNTKINNYKRLLEESISFRNQTKTEKLVQNPVKILPSFVLEIIARRFNRSFKMNIETFWGDQMTVVIPEIVSLTLSRYGFFEEGLTKILLEYLKPGDTFFDIGAHFGYFTLLGSAIVGKSGEVHAFEPTPGTFAVLQSNARGKSNATINNYAVFSTETSVAFTDYGTECSAFNSVFEIPLDILKRAHPKRLNVQALSIDKYIRDKQIAPNFIKIDAELAEFEILKGMGQTINSIRPIISLEVSDMNVRETKDSRICVQYLLERGYQAYEYREGNILEHHLKEGYSYNNILFLPSVVR